MKNSLTKTRRGLTSTDLKTIALVLMVLDHLHYFFEFTGMVPVWFSMLGRLSAPLFLFCTAEGFAHTRDRRAYVFRIWLIGGGMGAVEFFMQYAGALRRGDGFFPMNAIFQCFFLLCLVWQGLDWFRQKRFLSGAAVIAAVVGWPFFVVWFTRLFPALLNPAAFLACSFLPAWNLITDGGWFFLLGGVLLYPLRGNRYIQAGVWALWTFMTEFGFVWLSARTMPGFVWTQMFTDYFEWFGVFAAVLMLCYNGRRGRGNKAFFWLFYPAHVYLFYGLSCLLYTAMR